tara:strand:+ start:107 stop:751 length:645 start_codon:yes stop_codon:yes gene_type:complete
MAFHLKSKFTSNGFITNVKTGASPLLQNECLQYGKDPNTGERICVTDKSAGKPGTVSGPRGTIDETFANITPEQIAKVVAEGFTGDLSGYKQYVEGYNQGTLPSQAVIRDRSTTDATSEVKYSGKPRKYDQDYVTHYKLEYSSETPTWQEQKDVFINSERFKKLSDKNKDKQFKKFKRLFSDANGGIKWTKGNGKKKKIETNVLGKISDWKPRN